MNIVFSPNLSPFGLWQIKPKLTQAILKLVFDLKVKLNLISSFPTSSSNRSTQPVPGISSNTFPLRKLSGFSGSLTDSDWSLLKIFLQWERKYPHRIFPPRSPKMTGLMYVTGRPWDVDLGPSCVVWHHQALCYCCATVPLLLCFEGTVMKSIAGENCIAVLICYILRKLAHLAKLFVFLKAFWLI